MSELCFWLFHFKYYIFVIYFIESPEYLDRTNKKNPALDDRLKDVYVTSTEPPENEKASSRNDPDRPLPLKRTTDYFELGYKESDTVPPGKVSLIQAMKFITDHRKNPTEYTITRIAEDNNIRVEVAGEHENEVILMIQETKIHSLILFSFFQMIL